MIKVLKEFYDLKTGDFHLAETTFEASKERFEELNEILPGFVEWEESTAKPKGKKKDEVAGKDELPI
ncbi:hypothetical protein SORDD17_01358 [Streptococcus oralis]|uniref:Uncharacterized protein n=1 Tax=Streptococcus oralis TaxID=1303 RepID=A0A139RIP1_STROR|nr:hypothetical protein [Streptococcus oralis]KXU14601.1 hypothetical protein SORDD17_01358 [Streptococcus oralis]